MKTTSLTLAAALAALSTGALAVDNPPAAGDQAPRAVQKQERKQLKKQMKKQERKQQQMQQQPQGAQNRAKQIEMNKERAIKKRMGPGPVA